MKGTSIAFLKLHDGTMTDERVTFDSLNGVILGNTCILREMQNYVQTYSECARHFNTHIL